jgi:hypothetical protein
MGTVHGMTDATGKVKYSGGLVGMRQLGAYLREEGLEVSVETSEERRDAVATIEAIITIAGAPGTVVSLAVLVGKMRKAISRFRQTHPGEGNEIKIIEPVDGGPDDGGFLP